MRETKGSLLVWIVIGIAWLEFIDIAYAQGEDSAPGTDALTWLLTQILKLAALVLSGVLILVGQRFYSWVKAKTGIDLTTATSLNWKELADHAVAYGEEQARKNIPKAVAVVDQAASKAVGASGEKKMEAALSYVKEFAEHYGVESMAEDKIKKLLEARLSANRMSGTALQVGELVPGPVPQATVVDPAKAPT